MHVKIPEVGYWLTDSRSLPLLEDKYNAEYMGYWCIKDANGNWTESPVDVFYNANPDVSKGHSNYFGIYRQNGTLMICDAKSAFVDPLIGLPCEDGEVLISKYRHDYVEKDGKSIDGGRDYLRTSNIAECINVFVIDGEFKFNDGE